MLEYFEEEKRYYNNIVSRFLFSYCRCSQSKIRNSNEVTLWGGANIRSIQFCDMGYCEPRITISHGQFVTVVSALISTTLKQENSKTYWCLPFSYCGLVFFFFFFFLNVSASVADDILSKWAESLVLYSRWWWSIGSASDCFRF